MFEIYAFWIATQIEEPIDHCETEEQAKTLLKRYKKEYAGKYKKMDYRFDGTIPKPYKFKSLTDIINSKTDG